MTHPDCSLTIVCASGRECDSESTMRNLHSARSSPTGLPAHNNAQLETMTKCSACGASRLPSDEYYREGDSAHCGYLHHRISARRRCRCQLRKRISFFLDCLPLETIERSSSAPSYASTRASFAVRKFNYYLFKPFHPPHVLAGTGNSIPTTATIQGTFIAYLCIHI